MKLVIEVPDELAAELSQSAILNLIQSEMRHQKLMRAESAFQTELQNLKDLGTNPEDELEAARQEAWERLKLNNQL